MVPRGDVPGRGKDGEQLTVWVYSLAVIDDLFTLAAKAEDDDRIIAVMDANVFFDLHGEDDLEKESRVLLEPWFDDSVKLCVVDELRNEINRQLFAEHREHCHRAAQRYPELTYATSKSDSNLGALTKLLGREPKSDSEASDRKQLARSAAAGAQVFLTRDEKLLDMAPEIYAQLGIEVMRPTELSSRLDEVERAAKFQPIRLSATPFTTCVARAAEVDEIASRLQLSHLGEKASALEASIRHLLAQTRSEQSADVRLVRDSEEQVCAFIATQGCGNEMRIHHLRASRAPLADTLIRHLLLDLIRQSSTHGMARLRFEDRFVSPAVGAALVELSFVPASGVWTRETPTFVGSAQELARLLKERGSLALTGGEPAEEIERRLWPAKITGAGIGCAVVPIRPTWAAQLFDSRLAGSELFGVKAHLALNRENVYYRRPRNGSFTLPCRVLWYVSQDHDVPDTMCIRACSRLLAVEVGPVKELYARYRRLGVYEWPQIQETVDPETGEIMVLHFSDTEEFKTPVPLAFAESIGIKSNFPSPVNIREDQFISIYQKGMVGS